MKTNQVGESINIFDIDYIVEIEQVLK